MLFVAQLRWAYSTERRVEGGHAAVHIQTSSARNRTEAYDSLALRLAYVRQALEDDPDSLMECLSHGRSPRQLAMELGFKAHPSFAMASCGWDPIIRKMVYHADAFTLYRMPLPDMPFTGGPPPPAPPLEDMDTPDAAIDDALPDWSVERPPVAPPALPTIEQLESSLYGSLKTEAARVDLVAAIKINENNK